MRIMKIISLAVIAPLAACNAADRVSEIGEGPRLAAVGNPAGSQIVAEIPRPAPIRHVNNSLWQTGAKSFFNDPRARNIGDVITVNVSTSDAAKLSNTTFEGIQKLTELNLQAAKAAMADGQAMLQAVSASKDPGDVLKGNAPQPAADKAIEYARHVCEIATQAQADLARAVEEQYELQQRNVQAFVDAFVKNAPAGSEAISATLQATLDNATQSYRAAQAISQQLTGLASTTFTATPGAATGSDRQPTHR